MKNKPTYEEKLKALKESIIHWENDVVPDPEHANVGVSTCPCCILDAKYGDVCEECFIADKVTEAGCCSTPYPKFSNNRTKENALVEVVFLKNLYIEMLELGGVKEKREKKKEEWVDVTEEIDWEAYNFVGEGYWLMGTYKKEEILYFTTTGLHFNHSSYKEKFKIKEKKVSCAPSFRILKKV